MTFTSTSILFIITKYYHLNLDPKKVFFVCFHVCACLLIFECGLLLGGAITLLCARIFTLHAAEVVPFPLIRHSIPVTQLHLNFVTGFHNLDSSKMTH